MMIIFGNARRILFVFVYSPSRPGWIGPSKDGDHGSDLSRTSLYSYTPIRGGPTAFLACRRAGAANAPSFCIGRTMAGQAFLRAGCLPTDAAGKEPGMGQ